MFSSVDVSTFNIILILDEKEHEKFDFFLIFFSIFSYKYFEKIKSKCFSKFMNISIVSLKYFFLFNNF